MEVSVVTIIIFVAFILLLYFLFRTKRPQNFPPGPDGIPLLGNVLQMGYESFKVALEMSEKYGDVIGIQMGQRWAVVLNDVDDIRDAFGKHEFTGRNMYNSIIDEISNEKTKGVIMSEGRIWTEQRRFCLRTLRDFGFGKKSMETIIMEEANDLMEELKKKNGKSFKTTHVFNAAVVNVIWSIVAGERFPHDDPQLEELIKLLIEMITSTNEGLKPFYFLFPTLARIKKAFPLIFPSDDEFRNKAFEFFNKTIKQHRRTLQEGSPRDLIDTYLEEVAKTTDPNSSFYPTGSDDMDLIVLLMDFFIAGAETTSTTLTWSCFLLALHPKVQEKFFKEIQTIVGNRQVSLNDKSSLPYVEATMMEIMRVSSLTPSGVPHTAIQDTTFKNYSIPKDTIIFGNHYACHYRTSIWGDPHNFRPERFLSADEKTVIRSKYLIPFSVGKRACLGESLARDEFFLFLTNLVQTFYIGMPKDEPEHTLKLIPAGVASPEPHYIVLTERNL